MSDTPIRIPGPDHRITIEPSDVHIVVRAGGRVIVDTRHALVLREAAYPPVYYLPREDADMTAVTRSDHGSYCPYKGQASYYHIVVDGSRSANAIWTYETPHAAVASIANHLAFYPDRVDSIDATQ